ncbi:MAG TPA: hypothetical protein VGS28_03800 [Candidatus Saccharimonadales bacterium]|nr:hypothetical protein [Candidatus Saccharimonadales bacterium]
MLFRKLVSGLPFSPTLLGQLGLYASKLQSRLTIRRLGLLFIVLAIIVQLFVVLKPSRVTYAPNLQSITPTLDAAHHGLLKAPGDLAGYSFPAGVSGSFTINNLTNTTHNTIQPGDRLQYNLAIHNATSSAIKLNFAWAMGGLLDYSTIYGSPADTSLDQANQTLSWKDLTVGAKKTAISQVVILVDNRTPSYPRSGGLYNCSLTVSFDMTSSNLPLACSDTKKAENFVNNLPVVSKNTNLVILGVIFILTLYFEFRDQQIRQELKLIRKEFNNGAI